MVVAIMIRNILAEGERFELPVGGTGTHNRFGVGLFKPLRQPPASTFASSGIIQVGHFLYTKAFLMLCQGLK